MIQIDCNKAAFRRAETRGDVERVTNDVDWIETAIKAFREDDLGELAGLHPRSEIRDPQVIRLPTFAQRADQPFAVDRWSNTRNATWISLLDHHGIEARTRANAVKASLARVGIFVVTQTRIKETLAIRHPT